MTRVPGSQALVVPADSTVFPSSLTQAELIQSARNAQQERTGDAALTSEERMVSEYTRMLGSIVKPGARDINECFKRASQQELNAFAKSIWRDKRAAGLFNYLARRVSSTQLVRLFKSLNQLPTNSLYENSLLALAVANSAPDNTKLKYIQGIAPLIVPLNVANPREQNQAAPDAVGWVLRTLTGENFDAAIDSLNDHQLREVARGCYEPVAGADIVSIHFAKQFISILKAAQSGESLAVKKRMLNCGLSEHLRVEGFSPELGEMMEDALVELSQTNPSPSGRRQKRRD
jgi:hypothetical protein